MIAKKPKKPKNKKKPQASEANLALSTHARTSHESRTEYATTEEKTG
jgi:hypothetical protein